MASTKSANMNGTKAIPPAKQVLPEVETESNGNGHKMWVTS